MLDFLFGKKKGLTKAQRMAKKRRKMKSAVNMLRANGVKCSNVSQAMRKTYKRKKTSRRY